MALHRLTVGVLAMVGMVSVVGLAWTSVRTYFAVSAVVSLGLAVAILLADKGPQRERAPLDYDPCPRCGSVNVARSRDEIRYVVSPRGDMLRHYVRCSDCGKEFESPAGDSF